MAFTGILKPVTTELDKRSFLLNAPPVPAKKSRYSTRIHCQQFFGNQAFHVRLFL